MNVIGHLQVEGKPYAIVANAGGYVHGVFAKYLLTPMSCVEKQLNNMVEIVDDDICDTGTEQSVPSDESTDEVDSTKL